MLRAITKLSLYAGELGGEILGDAIGEVVLTRVAGEIGEGSTTMERWPACAGFM